MSADKFSLYQLCPECKGGGSEEVGGCSTCLGDNVVKTEAHVAALATAKATGMSVTDVLDMMRRVGEVEDAVCRGWWDRFADRDTTLRLAQALGIVVEDAVPAKR